MSLRTAGSWGRGLRPCEGGEMGAPSRMVTPGLDPGLLAHPFLLGRLLSALCSPASPMELMGLQRGGGQALGLDAPASWGGQIPTELPLIP